MPELRTGILSQYMTVHELAVELSVTDRTLDRWHAQRIGPPRTTIGRRVFYRKEAVLAWIRDREIDLPLRDWGTK